MDGCMSFRRGGGGREGGESGFEIARSVHENKGEENNYSTACVCGVGPLFGFLILRALCWAGVQSWFSSKLCVAFSSLSCIPREAVHNVSDDQSAPAQQQQLMLRLLPQKSIFIVLLLLLLSASVYYPPPPRRRRCRRSLRNYIVVVNERNKSLEKKTLNAVMPFAATLLPSLPPTFPPSLSPCPAVFLLVLVFLLLFGRAVVDLVVKKEEREEGEESGQKLDD